MEASAVADLGPSRTLTGPARRGRLAIDTHRLLGVPTGVARYLSALLREWATMELPFEEVELLSPAPLPREALPEDHPFSVRTVGGRLPVGVWAHTTLASAAREADILFCPSYVAPLLHRGPFVVTIHDAAHQHLPQTFRLRGRHRRSLYRRTARRADLVLTDSESAKSDLEHAYDLRPERVRAVPMGVDASELESSEDDVRELRRKHGLGDDRIVLFVGKLSHRRNAPLLVRAFARAREAVDESWTLVLAGPNHLGLPLVELGEELGLGPSLRALGFVPDDDLRALYRTAEVFALPTEYDSTSLTVLEAMSARTAVVTGGNADLRELAGDAAVLLPEISEESLTEALAGLMHDAAERKRYADAGLERAAAFSWRRTAESTMGALAEAAAVQEAA